jgi:peptidoglycan/LPS O-acetylase OafA/YrhL
MNRAVSSYLDAVRFLAAFSVVLAHLDEVWVPGFAPFFTHLGLEAVGIFFVLSGFVIGYVSDSKEPNWSSYFLNRAARLYSVAVPCLILTFALDNFTRYADPYYAEAHLPHLASIGREALKAIFSLTFLNSIWFINIIPGSNAPFWSLGYEAAYYAIYGSALFARGAWRILAPTGLCVLVGPSILCLLPLWLLGVALYRFCRVNQRRAAFGRPVLCGSITIWTISELARWRLDIGMGTPLGFWRDTVWQLYWGGIPFALTVIGVRYIDTSVRSSVAAPIRWLAGSTFTLYLLHYPVDRFLDCVLPRSLSEPGRWTIMLLSAVVAALLLAEVTERRKDAWYRAIEAVATAVTASSGWNRTLRRP